ncbi:MAG: hypothetical protein BWY82_01846 [Verrucomicrobia bacterium ADurb.Bin474]|nr:MAG: hypothetical protein BWY82_01846 [Verrucomicrobia bacterium ADurb.Bin474]
MGEGGDGRSESGKPVIGLGGRWIGWVGNPLVEGDSFLLIVGIGIQTHGAAPLGMASLPAGMLTTKVQRNRKHPCRETEMGIKTIPFLEYFDEGVLRQIDGCGKILRVSIDERDQRALPPGYDFPHGFEVALFEGFHESGVGLVLGLHSDMLVTRSMDSAESP